MKLVDKNITKQELDQMSKNSHGNLVKAVVDIEKAVMAVDAELHSDEESFLISIGSEQSNLWGVNLYPEVSGDDFIEFDSMINLRPGKGNMSRGVDDPQIQNKIRLLVSKLVS